MPEVFPYVIRDFDRRMADWGKTGVIDPFKEVYAVRFVSFPLALHGLNPPHEDHVPNDSAFRQLP